MPEISLRAAAPGDLPGLLRLYEELAGGRPSSLPAQADTAAHVFERILSDPRRTVVVAECGGHVVGSAEVLVAANLTHGGRPWALVENVVVASGSRRLGVGSALLDHLAGIAHEAGCYKIQLMSRKERTEAHEFYLRVGFQATAEGFRSYFD